MTTLILQFQLLILIIDLIILIAIGLGVSTNLFSANFAFYLDDTKVIYEPNPNITDNTDDLVNGALCGRDLFVARVQLDNLGASYCPAAIDKTLLTQIWDFSAPFADTTDPSTLINSALSANSLGFEATVVVASPDDTNAGLAASTPSSCDMKYGNSPWVSVIT